MKHTARLISALQTDRLTVPRCLPNDRVEVDRQPARLRSRVGSAQADVLDSLELQPRLT